MVSVCSQAGGGEGDRNAEQWQVQRRKQSRQCPGSLSKAKRELEEGAAPVVPYTPLSCKTERAKRHSRNEYRIRALLQ